MIGRSFWALAASVAGGCVPASRADPPPFAPSATSTTGTLAARVLWRGAMPPMPPLPTRQHADACGGRAVPFPALAIDARGGVAWSVVSIADAPVSDEGAGASTPVVLDQHRCQYTPHVVGLRRGATLEIVNSDSTLHNVHTYWGDIETGFNVATPGGMRVRRRFDRDGVARVVCDAGHVWMLGWVHVFAHPLYAVSGADGRLRIDGISPGEHTVRMWHEGWRMRREDPDSRPEFSAPIVQERRVTFAAGQTATVDFELRR